MMTERSDELTADELDSQTAEELPDREEMSLANINLAVPVNAGIAANVLSDGSTADAGATQSNILPQTNL
jgi:hypothetical protein